jgi:hypothetical protein
LEIKSRVICLHERCLDLADLDLDLRWTSFQPHVMLNPLGFHRTNKTQHNTTTAAAETYKAHNNTFLYTHCHSRPAMIPS